MAFLPNINMTKSIKFGTIKQFCGMPYLLCACWRQGHLLLRLTEIGAREINQGWGLLSQFPPLRYFPSFSESPKHTFAIEYHVYIWHVSPQLSCGDTCQIWMWLKESNRYFCKIKNFAYGEISERSFSNPHTRAIVSYVMQLLVQAHNLELQLKLGHVWVITSRFSHVDVITHFMSYSWCHFR